MADAKYIRLIQNLRRKILDGRYASGKPLPSERTLIRTTGLSRITVRHAFSELERQGLVCRQRGRGTFITKCVANRKVGLIVPGIAFSEFYPPVVGEISRCAQQAGYQLLFADIMPENPNVRAESARIFAEELVREHVAGVIYQPLESVACSDRVNLDIVALFDAAEIPVVLLDYDIVRTPERSRYDVVGIDNHAAGRMLVKHLFDAGARKLAFVLRSEWANSIYERISGAHAAVSEAAGRCSLVKFDVQPEDEAGVRRCMRRFRPDAIICGNDTTAAKLNRTLSHLGYQVPEDVLLAGVDDVQIASLMTPPLTTIHQPCRDIARAVFDALVNRIAHPERSPWRVSLPAPLVVRRSTQRGVAK